MLPFIVVEPMADSEALRPQQAWLIGQSAIIPLLAGSTELMLPEWEPILLSTDTPNFSGAGFGLVVPGITWVFVQSMPPIVPRVITQKHLGTH
jgi:hypothetical protein